MGRETTHRVVSDADRIRPDKSEVFELICDRTLAGTLLGWQPRVTLDEGLAQVIAYVDRHRGQFKAHLYNI
jgi:nucleoside-diphosphate-sugar epimerase